MKLVVVVGVVGIVGVDFFIGVWFDMEFGLGRGMGVILDVVVVCEESVVFVCES